MKDFKSSQPAPSVVSQIAFCRRWGSLWTERRVSRRPQAVVRVFTEVEHAPMAKASLVKNPCFPGKYRESTRKVIFLPRYEIGSRRSRNNL